MADSSHELHGPILRREQTPKRWHFQRYSQSSAIKGSSPRVYQSTRVETKGCRACITCNPYLSNQLIVLEVPFSSKKGTSPPPHRFGMPPPPAPAQLSSPLSFNDLQRAGTTAAQNVSAQTRKTESQQELDKRERCARILSDEQLLQWHAQQTMEVRAELDAITL